MFSHSELLHLCVHPSKEPAALKNTVSTLPDASVSEICYCRNCRSQPLQAKATTDLPGALACLVGRVQCFLHRSTASAARAEGKPAKGGYMGFFFSPPQKVKSLTGSIVTKTNRKQPFHHGGKEGQRLHRFHQKARLRFQRLITDLLFPLVFHW